MPLQLPPIRRAGNSRGSSKLRALKQPEGCAPKPERAVHGASPFVHPARPIFREASILLTLKRHEYRAPMHRAATGGVRIRRDGGRCSTANRAGLSPEMLSGSLKTPHTSRPSGPVMKFSLRLPNDSTKVFCIPNLGGFDPGSGKALVSLSKNSCCLTSY